MTVKETAEYLRIPLPTVYYLVQRGQLPAIQIGGRWRVKRDALDRDVLRNEQHGQQTVLVVDDDEDLQNMFKLFLKKNGYSRLVVGSGKDAIAALEKQLSGVAGSLVDKSLRSPRQPVIKIPVGNKPGEGGAGDSGGIPGRQSLDEALGKAGGPVSGKPVAMRGGALFEHGKADLLPEAVLDLQKLGQLIRRNPKSTFIISGHTDHTGTYEGNVILSQQRADAVRYWLVSNLGIDPARITTIGKADTEAFPALGPDKSIEEQAPNRRVEIVIKTNRN
jgi:excisionase family DNA binding protein